MTTRWTDDKGTDWNCRLTIEEAQRLKTEDSIDLLDSEKLTQIVSDPFAVVHLLTCIHRGQCKEREITAGDFAELCTGSESVAQRAADALIAALADFFKRLRKPALADVVEKAGKAAKAAEERAFAMVQEKGDQVIQTAVDRVSKTVGDAIAKALE